MISINLLFILYNFQRIFRLYLIKYYRLIIFKITGKRIGAVRKINKKNKIEKKNKDKDEVNEAFCNEMLIGLK